MIRSTAILLFAMAVAGGTTRGQVLYAIGSGSTVQGDYLRGVGVAAVGMGYYNLTTARAISINVDTSIRLNEYIAAVLKNENRENYENRVRIRASQKAAWDAIRRRIGENPENRDIMNGDALNEALKQILDLKIDDSSFRSAQVPLTVGLIRRVPFKIGREMQELSLRRLRARGKDRWPVGLQDDFFAAERKAYESAVDDALLEQIGGKMSLGAIARIDEAIKALSERIDSAPALGRGRLLNDARSGVRELKATAEVFKSRIAERLMGDLDKFSGTTVHDLMKFMQAHDVQFAVARTPDERRLYAELYSALALQRELVSDKKPGQDLDRDLPAVR